MGFQDVIVSRWLSREFNFSGDAHELILTSLLLKGRIFCDALEGIFGGGGGALTLTDTSWQFLKGQRHAVCGCEGALLHDSLSRKNSNVLDLSAKSSTTVFHL